MHRFKIFTNQKKKRLFNQIIVFIKMHLNEFVDQAAYDVGKYDMDFPAVSLIDDSGLVIYDETDYFPDFNEDFNDDFYIEQN